MSGKLSEDDIKAEIDSFVENYKNSQSRGAVKSEDFTEFSRELIPVHFTFYEKACNFCDRLFKITLPPEKEAKLKESIETCHLNTTPNGVLVFSFLFPVLFMIFGSLVSFLMSHLLMQGEGAMFFVGIFLLVGVCIILPLGNLPNFLANGWRMKASNQMVLSIFYIVSYMRHTSNLERAIKFTSEHLVGPLAIDLKKVIWNVESSKFDSIKESLDDYLEKWKGYNMEFVESMHLIESSLYETSEKKRLYSLEKSMSLILEATYEKMLHYAQELKSPITMLHMLGVILPILGLVILPLVVSFMENMRWYHIAVLYNILLISLVWYLGKVILSTRPTGYGQADITEVNPELKRYSNIEIPLGKNKAFSIGPKWIALILAALICSIGFIPLLIHAMTLSQPEKGKYEIFDIVFDEKDFNIKTVNSLEALKKVKFSFLEYRVVGGRLIGPYGIGATLLSIAIPLGAGIGISFYYRAQTKKLLKIREKTKQLENEFASAIFQLGNRIGDGIPGEIAFGKVASTLENTSSGKFFELVSSNVSTLGMGVEDAIFDKKHGAINKFPSSLIESSMKVFVESVKKGPDVAAEALLNISTYIKEMHRVDERLKDLMAEITSSMRSQINFLAPVIAGVVIGLTSMITTIMGILSNKIEDLAETATASQAGVGNVLQVFGEAGIPTYYFQIVVGLYIVQITYLLTTMLNTIESGYDPLNEKHLLSQYIYKSTIMYSVVAFIVILLFNLIAATVVSGIAI